MQSFYVEPSKHWHTMYGPLHSASSVGLVAPIRHGTELEKAEGMLPFAILAAHELAAVDASDPLAGRAEAKSDDICVRAVAGVGGGELGPALRIGLQDEYWFARRVGFGVAAGAAAQARLFGNETALLFVAPALSFRSSMDDSWWIVGLSAGYAYREDEYRSSCFWGPCPDPVTIERHGVYFGVTAGWLAHPGPVEVGPLLVLDAALADGRATAMVTLNLALGFSTD